MCPRPACRKSWTPSARWTGRRRIRKRKRRSLPNGRGSGDGIRTPVSPLVLAVLEVLYVLGFLGAARALRYTTPGMSHDSYEAVIGLEVHVQLLTETKMFCRCPNRFGAAPNTLVCPVCLGYPGTLPVPNRHAVDLAVELALAVGCTVHETSIFARKNYFYPDLPKGYQISQFDRPLAEDGLLPLTSL